MASNSIKIFDDTVIKLSINQGLEDQRSSEVLGNFTSGELAYTRDTGRLFVGDNSDGEPGHIGLQETIGGSLAGNKYLGLIDSKPLVTFYNNGEPLSYEETSTATGTQELQEFVEPGLLTSDSKFRLHSNPDADETWSNWDRTAVYNPKYNAYNGDFMYDVYQNALILFDTRISGSKTASSQPQIKVGDDGLPVEPETFIVDGVEISSDDPRALNLTRRTILQNYSKTNTDVTNSSLVYGDGYVIMRMVEPDNQTIRFKKKAFQINGQPEAENNYTHNLLEVFNVTVSAISGNFSDDFVIDDIISLNKDIANVKSITGVNGNLKVPGTLSFSTPTDEERGATTYMQWTFVEPNGITVPTDDKYKLVLTPTAETMEDGRTYVSFDAKLEEEKPYAYIINLENGLESNQENPLTLVIDENATSSNTSLCPTLTIRKVPKEIILVDENSDPYQVDADYTDFYSGTLGVDNTGTIKDLETYEHAYYAKAKDRIEKWEDQNPSVNFIKSPVTILQSSTAADLYKESGSEFADEDYNFTPSDNITIEEGPCENIEALIKLAAAASKGYAKKVKNEELPPTEDAEDVDPVEPSVIFADNVLKFTNIDKNGVGIVLAGTEIPVKSYLKTIEIAGKVTGLVSEEQVIEGNVHVFAALINNGNVLKIQEQANTFKNFSFEFGFSLDEVLVSGTTYIVTGILVDNEVAAGELTYSSHSITKRNVEEEEIFTLSDTGVNVNLDFNVSPYVFCTKKVVSSPNGMVLPEATLPGQFPSQEYFTNFTEVHNKTWNNLVTVLGRNHYSNLGAVSYDAVLDDGYESDVKNDCFKFVSSYEVENTEGKYSIKKHTTVTEEDDIETMAFSWYKEYKKAEDGSETDIIYYPYDTFDRRSEEQINDFGKGINFIRVKGSEINLLNEQEHAGIVAGDEEEMPDNTFRKHFAIFWDSELVAGLESGVEYGNDELEMFYDFKKEKSLSFNYQELLDEEVKEVVFVKEGGDNLAFDTDLATKFPGNVITVDTELQEPGQGKPGDYDYMIFVYEEEFSTEDENGEPQTEIEESCSVYKILKEVSYLSGTVEPGQLSNVKIVVNGEAKEVTLDESVEEEDRVYIPTHARSILLELSHVTTENNTLAIMYANDFNDLGTLLPGLPVEEYNNPSTFSADVIINPSHTPSISESAYSDNDGTYKLKLGKTINTDTKAFHDTSKSTEENKQLLPSIYAPASKEKVLVNTSVTETRIIEVPLHKIPGTDVRHFALRLANVRPSNSEILNQLVLRVIGYRV